MKLFDAQLDYFCMCVSPNFQWKSFHWTCIESSVWIKRLENALITWNLRWRACSEEPAGWWTVALVLLVNEREQMKLKKGVELEVSTRIEINCQSVLDSEAALKQVSISREICNLSKHYRNCYSLSALWMLFKCSCAKLFFIIQSLDSKLISRSEEWLQRFNSTIEFGNSIKNFILTSQLAAQSKA